MVLVRVLRPGRGAAYFATVLMKTRVKAKSQRPDSASAPDNEATRGILGMRTTALRSSLSARRRLGVWSERHPRSDPRRTGCRKGWRAARRFLERLPPELAEVRRRPIRLDLATIDPDAPAARLRRRVRLQLFPGVELDVEETRSRRLDRPGRFQWSGRPDGDASEDVVLSVVDGRASGSISLRRGFFRIQHVAGDFHEVVELVLQSPPMANDAILPTAPPLGAALSPVALPKAAPGITAVAAAGDPVVDVLVLYTPEARTSLGGSQQIQDRALFAIAEANTSFASSQAAIGRSI